MYQTYFLDNETEWIKLKNKRLSNGDKNYKKRTNNE